jgi:hypothetical protein
MHMLMPIVTEFAGLKDIRQWLGLPSPSHDFFLE